MRLQLESMTASCTNGSDVIKRKGIGDWSSSEKEDPPTEPDMKKQIVPAELPPSEREEMIRLRAENERLRAEIAVVKKRLP